MLYTIENDYLKASISSTGAELVELIDKDGINRLHTPSEDTWNNTSPNLFPMVSSFKDNVYYFEGNRYLMPRHGFLRNSTYYPESVEKTKVVFHIMHNEYTLKVFPFMFHLFITFELKDNKLIVSYKVLNVSKTKMYFLLGGHPALKVPLYENERYGDYSLKFPYRETANTLTLNSNNNICEKEENYLLNQNEIALSYKVFDDRDTIMLKDLKSKYVDLVSRSNPKVTRVHFDDFKILAIWCKNKPNMDYICIEPWNIQDNFTVNIEEMGVPTLEPLESRVYSYTIEVLN